MHFVECNQGLSFALRRPSSKFTLHLWSRVDAKIVYNVLYCRSEIKLSAVTVTERNKHTVPQMFQHVTMLM